MTGAHMAFATLPVDWGNIIELDQFDRDLEKTPLSVIYQNIQCRSCHVWDHPAVSWI